MGPTIEKQVQKRKGQVTSALLRYSGDMCDFFMHLQMNRMCFIHLLEAQVKRNKDLEKTSEHRKNMQKNIQHLSKHFWINKNHSKMPFPSPKRYLFGQKTLKTGNHYPLKTMKIRFKLQTLGFDPLPAMSNDPRPSHNPGTWLALRTCEESSSIKRGS